MKITGCVTTKYTYGKLTGRTGTSKVIFGYNGRDGVITDDNGLIYMRARYYSPAMKRFINADVVEGDIANAVTLNRYAYANGNPVSYVDPFGLAVGWENGLKILGGALLIAGLAVVSVATAGTATAVIAGVAATGAAVSGTVGAAMGYHENGMDGAADGFLVGSISGAASGALGASGATATAVTVGNALISVGELYVEDLVEDGKYDGISLGEGVYAAVTGAIPFDSKGGILHSENGMKSVLEVYRKVMKKEQNRKNREYAAKAIRSVVSYYVSKYENALLEYAGSAVLGELTGIGIDIAADNVYEHVVDEGDRSK